MIGVADLSRRFFLECDSSLNQTRSMRRFWNHTPHLQQHTNVAPDLSVIGWREWLSFPDLGIPCIKAKIDTGARSSSLHAFDIEEFRRGKTTWLRFLVLPLQRSKDSRVLVEAPLVEYRIVRSSSGHQTCRPVIRTLIHCGDRCWETEITLSSRDEMGFRMLLGRQAIAQRFIVDSSRSFVAGKPKSYR